MIRSYFCSIKSPKASPYDARNLTLSHIPPGGGFTKGLGPNKKSTKNLI